MLVFCATPAAQSWVLPPAGAVEYSRRFDARASAVCGSQAAARKAACGESLPARYLNRLPPAPWLCDGELRSDRRGLVGQVGDLRDVIRAVACELRSAGGRRFARLLPFGDLVVGGSWSAADDGGAERFDGQVRCRPPKRAAREPAEIAERLQALCVRRTSGRLVIERTFDATRGVVTSFEGRLDLVVDEGDKRYRRLQIEDRWQLVAVRANQDFDFRKRVAEALRTGTAWVREQVAAEASFLRDRRGERNYGSGRLALALLTMLHGHVPADDEVLCAGFAELRRRRVDDAYSLAAALMAVAKWHRQRPLAKGDRKAAVKWLRDLLACRDTRAVPPDRLGFNYTEGARTDTSLQQYGLLGLRAAQQLGLDLPDEVFAGAARHLLGLQREAEGSLRLRLVDGRQLRSVLGTDAEPPATVRAARVCGFGYRGADDPAYGAMTSAGVSGLLLAREGLAAQGCRDRRLLAAIDAGIANGLAWLADHFSVRVNPGFAERADNHHGYWLYCLERCCELGGIARLHGRDWYYEGGLQLLAKRRGNGSFRSGSSALVLDSTCFAILFLARASAPQPITGK